MSVLEFSLLTILNNHLGKVQEQIQTINNNFDDKFPQKSLVEIETTAGTALYLADKNKKNVLKVMCFFRIHMW